MRSQAAAFVLAVLAACGDAGGPPLAVDGLRVYAPLPGSGAAVAYLTLMNDGDAPVALDAIESPQFGAVELHETRIEDGVARMRRIGPVSIPAGGDLRLEEGGAHLMLLRPVAPLAPGDAVMLEFSYDDGSLLVAEARLRDRIAETPPP